MYIISYLGGLEICHLCEIVRGVQQKKREIASRCAKIPFLWGSIIRSDLARFKQVPPTAVPEDLFGQLRSKRRSPAPFRANLTTEKRKGAILIFT